MLGVSIIESIEIATKVIEHKPVSEKEIDTLMDAPVWDMSDNTEHMVNFAIDKITAGEYVSLEAVREKEMAMKQVQAEEAANMIEKLMQNSYC